MVLQEGPLHYSIVRNDTSVSANSAAEVYNWGTGSWYNYHYKVSSGSTISVYTYEPNTEYYFVATLPTGNAETYAYINWYKGGKLENQTVPSNAKYLIVNTSTSKPPLITNFEITSDGFLRARNIELSGTITATSGTTIGGWTIADTALSASGIILDSTNGLLKTLDGNKRGWQMQGGIFKAVNESTGKTHISMTHGDTSGTINLYNNSHLYFHLDGESMAPYISCAVKDSLTISANASSGYIYLNTS